ncbi:unnamed protein product, partial [Polarella glacialis]
AKSTLDMWQAELSDAEVQMLMGGSYDAESCQFTIFAGVGGDEACDWVAMLERMYTNYAGSKGWKVSRLDFSEGDTMGLKSVELEIQGDYVFGMLKREQGTHRLVRVWNGKRQTSFAGIEIVPVIPETTMADIEIADSDITTQTFRVGGKGGQNVNKLETGVRLIHGPTGMVVKCTEERSQLLNKSKALKKLKSKLLMIKEQQQADELSDIRGDVAAAQWGAQVRNYVLHPYTLVKDVRTGHERGDADRVLDGDLESHIDALLQKGDG